MLQRLYSVGVTKTLQRYRHRLCRCVLAQTALAVFIFLFGSLGVALCTYTAELAGSNLTCGADGLSIWAPLQLFTTAMTAYFLLVKKHDHLTLLNLGMSVFSVLLGLGIFISNLLWAHYAASTFCASGSLMAVRVVHFCMVTKLTQLLVALLALGYVLLGILAVYTLAKTLLVDKRLREEPGEEMVDMATPSTSTTEA